MIMKNTKNIFVGEGTYEPTTGFQLARDYFRGHELTFYFGVRRSAEGLEQLNKAGTHIVANFPGRGMKGLDCPLSVCNLSTYAVNQAIRTGRVQPDAALVVASPPDAMGRRSVGTANGPVAAALEKAPVIFVEEYPEIQIVKGAPFIPADKEIHVISHRAPAYSALSRAPEATDYAIAKNIASLIPDGAAVQLGVGGIIEALADSLSSKKHLRSISGAIGSAIKRLDDHSNLNPEHPIYGSAIVGDDELIRWAATHHQVELLPSDKIHKPNWIASHEPFFSINIGISVDHCGNINAEQIGEKKISGKGGSPNFSKGAHMSKEGMSIFALRSDKGVGLVEKISKPTVQARYVDCIVTEKGIAVLKEKNELERKQLLEQLFLN